MIRKRVGLPEVPHPLLKTKPKELEGATAKEEVEELPEDIFIKPVNLTERRYIMCFTSFQRCKNKMHSARLSLKLFCSSKIKRL